MKYIFEDSKDDAISILFEALYDKNILRNFIYSNGNGNLANELDRLDENEDVAVFLDLVPDNRDTVRIYNKIIGYKKRFKSFIVFPIPCREYYYIKSLFMTQAMIQGYLDSIKSCLDINYYKDSDILSDGDRARTFEKFCKIVAIKGFIDCAKLTGRKIEYFENDCVCTNNNGCANEYTIKIKLRSILAAYMCVSSGSNCEGCKKLSRDECMDIHNELVQQYNEACEKFRKHGIKCKNIRSMFV